MSGVVRLTPVLAPTAGQEDSLPVRERVRNQSLSARDAVRRSSELSGLAIRHLDKNDRDVPLPDDGVYWSLSHTRRMVAGVVAPGPVGIDLEGPRDVRPELSRRVLDAAEATLLGGRDAERFLRAWTAKEAVLKCLGVGIAGLSHCRVTGLAPDGGIHLEFKTVPYAVHTTAVGDHLAALCVAPTGDAPLPEVRVEWILPS